jgi:hypothetical protein
VPLQHMEHHDGDGGILAHALSGLEGWLATALSEPRQRAWRADPRDVDGFRLQPVPARDCFRHCRLLLRARGVECYIIFNFLNPNAGWIHRSILLVGAVFAALVIPVFAYRHYVQDGGRFPTGALADLGLKEGDMGVLVANWIFVLPS